MDFKVLQPEFSKALLTCGKSILSRANLPILSNVLIKASTKGIEIVSTNLETATKVQVGGKVGAFGEITLSGKMILEFVSQLPEGEVKFEKLGEEVIITTKGYSGRFPTMPPEEFPAIPKIEKGISLEVDSVEFAERVLKIIFSAAADEGRPILTGALCEINKNRMRIVVTDGYRLGYEEVAMDSPKNLPNIKINVPARALSEVAKIIAEDNSRDHEDEKGKAKDKINILISDALNQINFKINGVEFTSRLIEGEYPNWQKIIPSTFNTKVTINRAELIKLVKITSIFARESGNIIKLKFEPTGSGKSGKLSVLATSSQVGSSDVSCEVGIVGKGGEIAFNYRYLTEVLLAIDDEEINFEMNESLNPGKITGLDPKDPYFHIIMPVRLQA